MFKTIDKEQLLYLRSTFTEGLRVKLLHMNDSQAPPVDTLGTVIKVDDIGSIHVAWDNGLSLAVVYDEDSCVPVDVVS